MKTKSTFGTYIERQNHIKVVLNLLKIFKLKHQKSNGVGVLIIRVQKYGKLFLATKNNLILTKS